MIPSPLSLETYFFTHVEVDAQPVDADNLGEGGFSSHLECARHEDEPGKWLVELGLKLDEDEEDGCPPYTFRVETVGLFAVEPEYPEKKVEAMVRVNGAAVLYGFIRELVANLTARGPFPQVHLPTVTFIDEVETIAPTKESEQKGEPTGNGD